MHPQTEKMVSSKGLIVDKVTSQRKAEVVPEDDIEEGVNIANTQKIPISLIKQQEKLPQQSQVPFYNPKVSGPKLNNYISQAAAFNKKGQVHHASTSNLSSGAIGNQSSRLPIGSLMNHSVGQLTINTSMNQ